MPCAMVCNTADAYQIKPNLCNQAVAAPADLHFEQGLALHGSEL
jgi:hypothetical protein